MNQPLTFARVHFAPADHQRTRSFLTSKSSGSGGVAGQELESILSTAGSQNHQLFAVRDLQLASNFADTPRSGGGAKVSAKPCFLGEFPGKTVLARDVEESGRSKNQNQVVNQARFVILVRSPS